MKRKTHRVPKELKDQILKRIKEDGISASQAAEDHGVTIKTIYGWLQKGVTRPVSWSEFNKLKKENQELKTFIGEITVELSKSKKKS